MNKSIKDTELQYLIDTIKKKYIEYSSDGKLYNNDELVTNIATTDYVREAITAATSPDITEQIDEHDMSEIAHTDIREMINELRDIVNDIDTGSGNISIDNTLSVEGQAADAKAVGDALNQIPISVDDDGYTNISGLRPMKNWEVTETANSITFKFNMDGDIPHTHILNFNDDGYPTSLVINGVEVRGTWTVEGEAALNE